MTRRGGFTILEVLAALAIFAGAAIVMGTAYINVLMGYQHAERATRTDADVQFAREILFRQPDLEKVEEGGDFATADGRQLTWRAEVVPTNVADLFDVIFEVEISGNDDVAEQKISEQFRMLRPTWSEDDDRDKLRQESLDRITEYLERRQVR
ncbi:prepilin-type N-terminal cleavage/methylation domain-containing protein [Synoicihabitans lomoniglobus]|uniref:Prepilin-type N-terminal cleavage/methylation domain-containing protein n=1 Tax=Synoicihabitans lomoniglobus TaxID=2909285 RepID=A0AAE9ZWY6_9BACT|nr:prepilin-type N-terminal cleavage/methylation domain-containing protein [Opitutaceae bacterium LMO-M01]WED65682.1 prepilin-type N-terminal cleavage/methylation domain-containing protein [Opitutaceae bacterium LMO-M01]